MEVKISRAVLNSQNYICADNSEINQPVLDGVVEVLMSIYQQFKS